MIIDVIGKMESAADFLGQFLTLELLDTNLSFLDAKQMKFIKGIG